MRQDLTRWLVRGSAAALLLLPFSTQAQVLVPASGSNTIACGTNETLLDPGGASNYPNSANGFTVLEADGSAAVNISGSYSVETNFDFIRIYDGVGTGGTLLQTYTGSGTANFTGTPGQTLTVRFTSDGSVTQSGFSFAITYTGACLPPPATLVPATGSITVPCGTTVQLQDPGGTSNYPNNADGFAVLEAGFGATVSINGPYDTETNFDFVRIYDGVGTGGTLLQSYTGVGTVNYVGNPGQTLTVRFQSDGSITDVGFDLAVTSTGPCVQPPVLVPATGNNTILCGTNSQLLDPGGTSNYPNSANGFTVLEAGGNAVIAINGPYDTETNFDFIRIYDGVGTGGTLLQTYTGVGTASYTGNPGQTLTVRFQSDGSVTDVGFDFAVTYTGACTLPCTPPTATASSVCNGSNFDVVVDVTDLGDSPGVGVVVDGILEATVLIADLPFNATYGPFTAGSPIDVNFLHGVNAACDVNVTGLDIPALCNDDCSAAIAIPSCPATPISGTTIGSTVDAVWTDCGSGGDVGFQRGVWYSYDGDDNQVTITTCDPGGIGYDTRLTIYSGSCGALSCVTGNDDMSPSCTTGSFRSEVTFNAFSGTTYYIFVHGFESSFNATDLSAVGNFNLAFSCAPLCLPVPGNDECANADNVPVTPLGSSCTPTVGDNTCAGATAGGNPSCESAFATLPDVYFEFTATSADVLIDLTDVTSSGAGFAVYDACGGTQIACSSGNASNFSLTGLTVSNQYWIRVNTATGSEGSFELCVKEACVEPTTDGGNVAPDCANDQFFVNVDLTGLGTSSTVDIESDLLGIEYDDVSALQVYAMGPYASGSTVTITIRDNNGGDCDVTVGTFSYACPPPNDLCANAIPVACNSLTLGTTTDATSVDAPPSCLFVTLNTAGGVWYTVTGWGGQMTATTCNTATTFFDTKLAVYDGTGGCGALVCVGANDDASPSGDPNCLLNGLNRFSKVTWTSTPGTTYYIYVTGFGTSTGDFGLEVACGMVDPACTDNTVILEMTTDGAGAEVSHTITGLGLVTAVSSQNGYPDNTTTPVDACLPDGTYRLEVSDAGNNGITGGGYVLRDGNGNRIIDNAGNGDNFTSLSAMAPGRGFQLPVGPVTLYAPFCDKEDLSSTATIRCNPDAAVSAEFGVNDANSGYQWRFFDPNGSYVRNIFISHANPSDPGKPAGAGRATWLRFQSIVTLPLPQNILLNVQVRPRVNGVYGNFGPVCRLVVDDVAAGCPTTTLIQDVNNPNFSCGVQRVFGPFGNTISAQPVLGANRYRFRFEQIGDAFVRNIAIPGYTLTLNWGTLPLTPGASYNVFVQVSFDGGANYCPDGDPCVVDIISPPSASTRELDEVAGAVLNMWPNPNRGDQLYLTLSELPAEEMTVNVDIYDLFGKRVAARTVSAQGGLLNTVISLDGQLASGMYMVNITAGDQLFTERLIIE